METHIPYMLLTAIPAFVSGFVVGGYTYRLADVARRWRRSRRVPAREIVDAMKAGAKARAEGGAE